MIGHNKRQPNLQQTRTFARGRRPSRHNPDGPATSVVSKFCHTPDASWKWVGVAEIRVSYTRALPVVNDELKAVRIPTIS
jgi:hypothetical protein